MSTESDSKRRRVAVTADDNDAVAPTVEELSDWRIGIEARGWTHMNAAGASPSPEVAHKEMLDHLELERAVGGYAAAAQRSKAGGRDARVALGELLSCDADEIALVESAQAGWAKAFYSLDFRQDDRIFCFASEYAGNAVAFLQMANRTGAKLMVLPLRADGTADVEALKAALAASETRSESNPRRTLVALTHVQTNSSIVQPAAEVGALAKKYGAVFLLDACQSVGQMEVNVRALQCDFASGTGRKWLRGPRGTGFLYARRGCLALGNSPSLVTEPSWIDHVGAPWIAPREYHLQPSALRYEMFEASEAARAGLAAAVDVCLKVGPKRISQLSRRLAARLEDGLAAVPGVTLREPPLALALAGRCAIVTFDAMVLGMQAEEVRDALAERKIAVSVSPSSHSFDEAVRAKPPAVRVSPTYFNTEAEVDHVVEALREILAERRCKSVSD
eukprot:TRINITY_DN43540_c0_g1_i1.p1 TRINITY_DN43540_c0_g1~~TRINITY_DN43540_c0_g1_i1.p1  ORF type:complete len:448 (-),score=79.01 TRINITY_DN43540_c0_g1_i1:5-1348(-)